MSIDNLRQELKEARERFVKSTWPDYFAADDEDWANNNGDLGLSESEWTPRRIAEHSTENELFIVNLIATTLGHQTISKRFIDYESANEVPEGHYLVAKETNKIYDLITNEDLETMIKEVPKVTNSIAEYPPNFDGTIGGLIRVQISHLIEHAESLRSLK